MKIFIIVVFFRNKLGKINTVEYIDSFFGENGYLQKFMQDIRKNRKNYSDFLKYCERNHQIEERDDTYYQDVEKHFIKDTSSDYMKLFLYLSDNQDEPWFDEFFKLVDIIYEQDKIVFGSRLFNRNFEYLDRDFISLKFSYDQKNNIKPKLTPPIFVDYGNDLMLDRQFREIISVIPPDKRSKSRTIRLRKYIESQRLRRKDFLESKDGKEMKELLKENQELSEDIFRVVQKWILNNYFGVINEKERITDDNLSPFWHIREVLFRLEQYYKGNSTNWAKFDKEIRELGKFIIGKIFPNDAPILKYIELREFKSELLSPITSNIKLTKILNQILRSLLKGINIFDGVVIEKNRRRPKQEKPKEKDPGIKMIDNVIMKLKNKCQLKESDIIQFLEQFQTKELKMGIAILLDNLYFYTIEEMANNIIEEIKNCVENYNDVYLVLFQKTRLKSQDIWANFIPRYSKFKFKIINTIELLKILNNVRHNKEYYFVFLDDIIGWGDQFIKYFKEDLQESMSRIFKIKNFKSNVKFILIAGVGSVKSKSKIKKELPVIDEIRYRKTIRDENRAFNPQIIKDKEILENLINFLRERDPDYYNGRNDSQYLVACQWSIPNNTIGCLWHQTEKLKPLFRRISYGKPL